MEFFFQENIIIPLDVIGIESTPSLDITYDAVQNNVVGEPPREQTLAPQEVCHLVDPPKRFEVHCYMKTLHIIKNMKVLRL